MGRRHNALIPLTHDHHHALAQARRLRVAAAGEADERLQQAGEFLEFFHADTIGHFREEEEILFPLAVDDDRATDLLAQVMVEHLRIHALVRRLATEFARGDVTKEGATNVATTLEQHVRLEEGKVFPLLEEIVSPELLDEISTQSERRRS